MQIKLVVVLFLTLFCFSMAYAAKPAFEYIGLDINTTAEDLHKRYANSNDQKTAETNSYYIWVAKPDVKGGVYGIKLIQQKDYWPQNVVGVQPVLTDFKWLTLSFEKPVDFLDVKPRTGEENHYFRHPTCESISTVLIKKYGSPFAGRKYWEEQIKHQYYKWEYGDETMTLRCYKIRGKGISLANDIVISKPVNGSNK